MRFHLNSIGILNTQPSVNYGYFQVDRKNLYGFFRHLYCFYHPSSVFISLSLITAPVVHISVIRSLVKYYSLLYCSPIPLHQQWSLFSLLSPTNLGFALTLEP